MMHLSDYENAIANYLIYSGQDPEEWDVDCAALEMREKFPDINNIDEVDPYEFTKILVKNHD